MQRSGECNDGARVFVYRQAQAQDETNQPRRATTNSGDGAALYKIAKRLQTLIRRKLSSSFKVRFMKP